LGQKTNPVGLRVGIIRGWDSNWYENKSYASKLAEDVKLRNYVSNRLKKAGISRIIIDRTSKNVILTIHTSRPGVVIGKSGKEIAQLEKGNKQPAVKFSNSEYFINHVLLPAPERVLLFGAYFIFPKKGKAFISANGGWMLPIGQGRLFYFMAGHSIQDYHESYCNIIKNTLEFGD